MHGSLLATVCYSPLSASGMREASTLRSELVLVAEKQPLWTQPDWTWVADWLNEALGVSVCAVVTESPQVASSFEGKPAVYYGSPEFLRVLRSARSQDVEFVGLATGSEDWLSVARRCLRHDEGLEDVPRPAIIDRGPHRPQLQLARQFPKPQRRPPRPRGRTLPAVF